MESIKQPRIKHWHICSTSIWQNSQEHPRDVQKILLTKLGKYMQKKKWNQNLSHTIHKMNLKWIKEWNIRPDTKKCLEENISKKPSDTGNAFLDMTPKPQTPKAKINKRDHIKLKSFHKAKETINKMKSYQQKGRKYLQSIY